MRKLIIAVSLVAQIGFWSVAAQDENVDVKALLKRIEELEQKVKALESNRVPAPPVEVTDTNAQKRIGALDQQVKILEHQRELEAEAAETKSKEATSLFKTPSWLTEVRLINDLRLRYDGVYAPDSDFVTRHRVRPRLRLGGIATLKDDFEIGFRLASTPSVGKDSGGDPLSTNQTFEDNGSRKPVGIDWAFARWTPIHTPEWNASFALGKLENPPNFTENVFDTDYTPEGLAEQFSFKPNLSHTISAYFGQYMLDELQFSESDPFLFLEQLRLDSKWNKRFASALTVSGLSIANPGALATIAVPDSNHGNTRTPTGALVNDYQLFIGDASVTYSLDHFPLYKGAFPIKLAGEYIHNLGAERNNVGYSYGPSFGRVTQTGRNQSGNWEFSYRYQFLEGDANYEELTASDNGAFYRSRPMGEPYGTFRPTFLNGLNLRGHAFRFAFAPYDSLVIDARVWLNEAIKVANPGDNPEGMRVLVDLIWKF
jgi:hypothetical protein